MPLFEWDARKADQNQLKHGISFDDAARALLGLALTAESSRGGESRFVSVCECGGRVVVVVWTPRDGAIRIVSARVASIDERAQYNQAVSRSAAARRQ